MSERRRTWSGLTERLVAGMAIIGVWVMSFGGMVISGGYAIASIVLIGQSFVVKPSMASVALAPAGIAMLLLSGWHIFATIVALIRPSLPAPVQIALSQPQWPRGVNSLIVVWWLMHVSTGALLAIAGLVERPNHPGEVIGMALMSVVFTYAAHGFLMLVATCLTRNPDWIIRVWGWRHVVSLGHGAAVLIVGLLR